MKCNAKYFGLAVAAGGLLTVLVAAVGLRPEPLEAPLPSPPVTNRMLPPPSHSVSHKGHDHKTADAHQHESHAHMDFGKAIDPLNMTVPRKKPSITQDDRDMLLVQLVNASTRQEKRKAITTLGRDSVRDAEINDVFHQRLISESDAKIQALLVRILIRDKTPKLADTIETLALGTRDPILFRQFLLALSKFQESISFPGLLNLAENAPPSLREQAVIRLAKQFPDEPETEILLAELH